MRRNVLIAACLGVVLFTGGAAIIFMQEDSPANIAPDDTTARYSSGIFTSEIRSSGDQITFTLVPEAAGDSPFLLSWELRENGTAIRSADREEITGPLTMQIVADRNPDAEYTFHSSISSPDGSLLSSFTSVVHRGETGTEVSRNVVQDKQM